MFMPVIDWRVDKMTEQSFVHLTNSRFSQTCFSSDLMSGCRFRSEPHHVSSSPLLSFTSHFLSITYPDRCKPNTDNSISQLFQFNLIYFSVVLHTTKLGSIWICHWSYTETKRCKTESFRVQYLSLGGTPMCTLCSAVKCYVHLRVPFSWQYAIPNLQWSSKQNCYSNEWIRHNRQWERLGTIPA